MARWAISIEHKKLVMANFFLFINAAFQNETVAQIWNGTGCRLVAILTGNMIRNHYRTHNHHQTVFNNSYGTHWQVKNIAQTGTFYFPFIEYRLHNTY
jgi:hypothetical protein